MPVRLFFPVLHLPLQPSFCFPLQVVREYERAIVFRLGHLLPGRAKGPGKVFPELPSAMLLLLCMPYQSSMLMPSKQTWPDRRMVFVRFLLRATSF